MTEKPKTVSIEVWLKQQIDNATAQIQEAEQQHELLGKKIQQMVGERQAWALTLSLLPKPDQETASEQRKESGASAQAPTPDAPNAG